MAINTVDLCWPVNGNSNYFRILNQSPLFKLMTNSTYLRKLVSLYEHGFQHFKNLEYKEAIICYTEALECYISGKTPNLYESQICFNMAMCFLAKVELHNAEKYLILSLEIDPFMAVSMYYKIDAC